MPLVNGGMASFSARPDRATVLMCGVSVPECVVGGRASAAGRPVAPRETAATAYPHAACRPAIAGATIVRAGERDGLFYEVHLNGPVLPAIAVWP